MWSLNQAAINEEIEFLYTITLTSTFPLHYFGSVLFKILIVDYVSLEIGKISAQPYTTLCIQFLDRENGSCEL